ncbi:MAG: transcription-repair-coupling factor [Gammaproteobacteria bacterium]|nr:MAG: transcription-repair-coupling factor [Gammaproteobacteria bacterium]
MSQADTPPAVRRWRRPPGDLFALAVAEAAAAHRGPVLVLARDLQSAARLAETAAFFAPEAPALFPDWETLPYDAYSPHPDAVSERLRLLADWPRRGLVIAAVQTALQKLPPREWVHGRSFALRVGGALDPAAFTARLVEAGYRAVGTVEEHGEFTVRGGIVDVFPMGAAQPLRIELLDQEIDSLRHFDPLTQRSTDRIEAFTLLPAREFPLTPEGIEGFRRRFRARFSGNPQNCRIYRDVSEGIAAPGCEHYLPLFFDRLETLFDYLPADPLVVLEDGAEAAAAAFADEVAERYERLRHDIERPLLEPAALYLSPQELAAQLAARPLCRVEEDPQAQPPGFTWRPLEPVALQPQGERPRRALEAFLAAFDGRVLFLAESPGRREVLLEQLRDLDVKTVPGWAAFLEDASPRALAVAPLEGGAVIEHRGRPIALIPEDALFGGRVRRQRRRSRGRDPESLIRSLGELKPGAPVVHEHYGVGRYRGLTTLDAGGVPTECLVLEYAGGDTLFVPVSSLELISRYTGAADEAAPLHRLGTDQWAKARRKAAEKIRDTAAELLELYARRAARPGRAFEIDHAQLERFAAGFPFEETPDQAAAIEAVLEDLRKPTPMDRVVCGDVGFGKTEVALRAAFVAAMNGVQVAVLVPTTLLAQQHERTFRDRFADWPLRIECISRLSSAAQRKAVLADLAAGKVDVVIGTHQLLQREVRFADLGLLIIDEEHRFGVRHKERLRALRAEVDVLTLTATPIPRTLNMALAGLRDLSIIATPPEHRLAVKTLVCEWRDDLIQEACRRELQRGGQVYFVHNEVRSIERAAERLRALLPQARIAVAHGQMPEETLEQVMIDFYHQRHNVLVCSTIIESGLDVPTANTIIIDRADRFGLAQLHQLRGRVGRSHHRAYAYLITPPRRALSADALKRLEAIEAVESLGAGFLLATHDLEIRGAGELLGEEQSGQITQIGYALYTEMLQRAIQALKQGEEPLLDGPLHRGVEIDLGVPALLPEDYVHDVDTRLVLYKRIAQAESEAALRELKVELIDRFGLLPEPAQNLFAVAALKLLVAPLGVRRIKAGPEGGSIEFDEDARIDPARLLRLLQSAPQRYRFDGKRTLRFHVAARTLAERCEFLQTLLLDELAAAAA